MDGPFDDKQRRETGEKDAANASMAWEPRYDVAAAQICGQQGGGHAVFIACRELKESVSRAEGTACTAERG